MNRFNKNLILKPVNQHKILTAKHCKKFYDISNRKIKTEVIEWSENIKLNKEILSKYKNTPDVWIIKFSNKSHLNLNKIPMYPIFYEDIFYISPISFEYINGFSNQYNNKEILISDFLNRIYIKIGALFVEKDFIINVSSHDMTGLNNLKEGILSAPNITNIPKWMVSEIPTNDFGWLAPLNILAIDYVIKNYEINSIAEFGIYMGKSTKYIANILPNAKYYCFDVFDNLFVTDYHSNTLTPEDTNFFFQYLRFDTFHSNVGDFKNIYSIKGDNYLGPSWLKKNGIKTIDMIYIDFIKNDVKLIDFVNELFELYPNAIIIGDDVVYLDFSIKYFEKKYNFVKMDTCYICTKNRKLVNKEGLLKSINNMNHKFALSNSSTIKNEDEMYQHNFICQNIKKEVNYEKINQCLIKFNKNPNNLTDSNNNNIYHYIAFERKNNPSYYYKLYDYLIKIYPDEEKRNTLNMRPKDYFSFNGPFFK